MEEVEVVAVLAVKRSFEKEEKAERERKRKQEVVQQAMKRERPRHRQQQQPQQPQPQQQPRPAVHLRIESKCHHYCRHCGRRCHRMCAEGSQWCSSSKRYSNEYGTETVRTKAAPPTFTRSTPSSTAAAAKHHCREAEHCQPDGQILPTSSPPPLSEE